MSGTRTIGVALGERSYNILIGEDVISGAGSLIAPFARTGKVVVVTDETVAGLHLPRFLASLDAAGIAHNEVVLPPGEGSKNFAHDFFSAVAVPG